MQVRLLYFAVLREIAGTAASDLSLAEGTTARQVWESLRHTHSRLSDYSTPPMVAINESYADPDALLQDGDDLAFIPPVAGG